MSRPHPAGTAPRSDLSGVLEPRAGGIL